MAIFLSVIRLFLGFIDMAESYTSAHSRRASSMGSPFNMGNMGNNNHPIGRLQTL